MGKYSLGKQNFNAPFTESEERSWRTHKKILTGLLGAGAIGLAALAFSGCGASLNPKKCESQLDGLPVTVEYNAVGEWSVTGNGFRALSNNYCIDADKNGVEDVGSIHYFKDGETRNIRFEDNGQTVKFTGYELSKLPDVYSLKNNIENLVKEARNKK